MSRNLRLIVEYDGTDFNGFQIQPHGRTVHTELIKCINRIFNSEHRLIIAARTDAGVHALGQVVNFHTQSTMDIRSLWNGLNSLLPPDISIRQIDEVPLEFHSRFSATSRVYRYSMYHTWHRSVFRRRHFWHYSGVLNREAMIDAVSVLEGAHDFSSFRAASDLTRHSIRRMIHAAGSVEGDELVFDFEANAFLQHMIRNIMGTLILVGRNKIDREGFRAILEACDRGKAGPTAPSTGLCLLEVRYGDLKSKDSELSLGDAVHPRVSSALSS